MPNAELAYRVLDHIDADPDSWRQNVWHMVKDCGTVACFAGWAVQLAGGRIEQPLPISVYQTVTGLPEVEGLNVPDAAVKLLGIEGAHVLGGHDIEDAADALFHPDNDREMLGDVVREVFGPRPERAS